MKRVLQFIATFCKGILVLDHDIRSITLALLFNGFAHGLVSVFIPFIIISHQGSLLDVTRFFSIYALTKLCLNYPAMVLIQRCSASFGLYVGFISGALELVAISLYTTTHDSLFLSTGAISLALANGFGWNAQHLYFSRALKDGSRGNDLASIDILGNLLGILSPIIAGTIASMFGSSVLLGLAVAIIVSTLLPLRKMYAYEKSHPLPKEPLQYSLNGAPKRDLFANFFYNIETAVGQMAWPLYLAIFIGGYHAIGFITTIGTIASLLVVRYAGRRGDKGRNRSTLRQGCTISACAHALRIFATSPLSISAVATLYQCSLRYMSNAWTSIYYYHAQKRGVKYIVSMEIACDIAYVLVWIPFYLVASEDQITLGFDMLFIMASVAAFGPLLITKESTERN